MDFGNTKRHGPRRQVMCVGLAAVLQMLSAGCLTQQQRGDFIPLGDGFGYVTTMARSTVAWSCELRYRGPDGGDRLVWRSLIHHTVHVHDGVAVFVARIADEQGRLVYTQLFLSDHGQAPVDISARVTRRILDSQPGATGFRTDMDFDYSFIRVTDLGDGKLEIPAVTGGARPGEGLTSYIGTFTWSELIELSRGAPLGVSPLPDRPGSTATR